MNVKKKYITEFVSSVIAFFNSLILFIKSINEMSEKNGNNIFSRDYFFCFIYFLILIVSVFMVIYVTVSYINYRRRNFKIENKDGISEYLINFIQSGGRTVILSRDLSWISDDVMWLFEKKSRNNELIIFIPEKNEISERLEKSGADIRYFGPLILDSADSIIKSRFTIIQWDSASARITYPKEDHTYHYNFEYVIGDSTMDLAQDLIRLLIKLVPKRQEKKENGQYN